MKWKCERKLEKYLINLILIMCHRNVRNLIETRVYKFSDYVGRTTCYKHVCFLDLTNQNFLVLGGTYLEAIIVLSGQIS